MAENDEENKRSVTILAAALGVALLIIALVISIVVFPLFISVFPEVVFFVSDSPEDGDQILCSMDGPYSRDYNRYMKDEWLLSDNISSYEDIPENQKENLSAEAREWLNDTGSGFVRVYNPITYDNLSKEEQELFRRGINNTTSFREEPDFQYVYYNKNTYYCNIMTPQPGA
jgi:hypothetical protein